MARAGADVARGAERQVATAACHTAARRSFPARMPSPSPRPTLSDSAQAMYCRGADAGRGDRGAVRGSRTDACMRRHKQHLRDLPARQPHHCAHAGSGRPTYRPAGSAVQAGTHLEVLVGEEGGGVQARPGADALDDGGTDLLGAVPTGAQGGADGASTCKRSRSRSRSLKASRRGGRWAHRWAQRTSTQPPSHPPEAVSEDALEEGFGVGTQLLHARVAAVQGAAEGGDAVGAGLQGRGGGRRIGWLVDSDSALVDGDSAKCPGKSQPGEECTRSAAACAPTLPPFLRSSAASWRCAVSRASPSARLTWVQDVTSCAAVRVAIARNSRITELRGGEGGSGWVCVLSGWRQQLQQAGRGVQAGHAGRRASLPSSTSPRDSRAYVLRETSTAARRSSRWPSNRATSAACASRTCGRRGVAEGAQMRAAVEASPTRSLMLKLAGPVAPAPFSRVFCPWRCVWQGALHGWRRRRPRPAWWSARQRPFMECCTAEARLSPVCPRARDRRSGRRARPRARRHASDPPGPPAQGWGGRGHGQRAARVGRRRAGAGVGAGAPYCHHRSGPPCRHPPAPTSCACLSS